MGVGGRGGWGGGWGVGGVGGVGVVGGWGGAWVPACAWAWVGWRGVVHNLTLFDSCCALLFPGLALCPSVPSCPPSLPPSLPACSLPPPMTPIWHNYKFCPTHAKHGWNQNTQWGGGTMGAALY